MVKSLSADAGDIREMGLSLCWEDPLEEVMATHSTILAWGILWTERPSGLPSIGSHSVGRD